MNETDRTALLNGSFTDRTSYNLIQIWLGMIYIRVLPDLVTFILCIFLCGPALNEYFYLRPITNRPMDRRILKVL